MVDAQYFGSGLTGQYYNNMTLSGTPVLTRTDPNVDFDWGRTRPSPPARRERDPVVGEVDGHHNPPVTGSYTFSLTSDDGSRLFINGQQVIDNWRDQASNTETAHGEPDRGPAGQVEVDYYQNGGGSRSAWAGSRRARTRSRRPSPPRSPLTSLWSSRTTSRPRART